MKVAPTLEGGLRIDAEDGGDWQVLQAIFYDARRSDGDLASELGGLISEEAGAEDWREYVAPDLRMEFEDQLAKVEKAVRAAMDRAGGGAGPVWVGRDEGMLWYGALNQARLALEEVYHFGPTDGVPVEELSPGRRTAFFRSQFYLAIQSLLLDHVLR